MPRFTLNEVPPRERVCYVPYDVPVRQGVGLTLCGRMVFVADHVGKALTCPTCIKVNAEDSEHIAALSQRP